MEDIENLIIIWIGVAPEELQSTFIFTKQFDSIDICKQYLNSLKSNNRFYIIMTTNDETNILQLINNPQIIAIYLFKTILDIKHTKIRGSFDQSNEVISKIRNDIGFHYRNFASPWNVFDSSSIQTSLNQLSDDNVSFIWSQLLLDILYKLPTTEDKDEQAKDEWLAECRRAYSHDSIEIQRINKFEREFCSEDATKWYISTGFAYGLLNQALRTRQIDIIYKCRFMLRELYQQLVQVQKKNIEDDLPIEIVYRAQEITTEELEKLSRSKDQLISMNAFFSTSIGDEVPKMFINNDALSSDGRHSILLEIKIDPQLISLYVFAYIAELSKIPDEMEVLFAPGTVFRVETVPMKNRNENYWRMNLRLARNDQCLEINRFMEEIRKKHLRYSNSLFALASVLAEMGETSSALLFYRMIIQQSNLPSETSNYALTALFIDIGSLYFEIGNYYEAIRFYKRALGLIRKDAIPHAVLLVRVYSHMIQTYVELGNYQRAGWFFIHSSQYAKDLPNQYFDTHAHLYNSMGNFKRYEGDFADSLKYFEKSINIIKQHMPHEYKYLIAVQMNIADVHQRLQNNNFAIELYKKTIALCEKILPSEKNSLLVKIYSNMSLCYSNQNEFDNAEPYIKMALEIAKAQVPINHDIMATCYNVYGNYYSSKKEYEQAYEQGILSMEHAKKLNLPDHHPSMKIYQEFLKNIETSIKSAKPTP